MRISDWSSDVCSSDQARVHHAHVLEHAGVVGVVVAAVEAVGALDLRFAGRAARLRGARAGADRGAAQQHEAAPLADRVRSEEHTSELQSLMRISYAVFCLTKQKARQQSDPRIINQLD